MVIEMSSRKKFFLLFLFILLDMFLLIGFLVIRDATMLNELKKEVQSLSGFDITKDRYNTPIQTRGNYAVVESAIKEYLDSYAVLLQDVLMIVKDPQLTQILSYNNYVSDGPLFEKSLTYLSQTKDDFNIKMDTLLHNLEESTIKGYIYDKIDDVYFQDLYQELMFTDDMKSDFVETRSLLTYTKNRVDNVLDVSFELLQFLSSNSEIWVLEDGEIKFQTDEYYNQYMNYISKITNES